MDTQTLLTQLAAEINELRESNPKEYVRLLEKTEQILKEFNATISS